MHTTPCNAAKSPVFDTDTTSSQALSPNEMSFLHPRLYAVAPAPGLNIATRAQRTEMGSRHQLRNLTTYNGEKCLYWFDDTYKKGRRLNILGHVWVDGEGTGRLRLFINGQYKTLDGAGLKRLYDQHNKKPVHYFYQHIRLISSHSAEGVNPLGQQVAQAFGLETKAFQGVIDTLRPETVEKLQLNRNFISKTNPHCDINQLLDINRATLVRKRYPTEPHKLAAWTGYNPVKFHPT